MLEDRADSRPLTKLAAAAGSNPEPTLRHIVGRVDRSLRTRLNARLQQEELTTPGYTMMFVLRRVPGISNAELARRAGLTPQTTIETLRGLSDRGLIERERSPQHARTFLNRLTAAGLQLIARCEGEAAAIEDSMLRGFTRAERAQFEQFLRRSADNLGVGI